MKLSEKYLQKLKEDIEYEQGITIEEIELYGNICKLEERRERFIGTNTGIALKEIDKTLDKISKQQNI